MVSKGQLISLAVRAAVCLLAFSGPVAEVSGAIYGRLNGFPSGIPSAAGESTAPGRTGWFDIDGFQFGAGVGISSVFISGSREIGDLNLSEMSMSKPMDGLSPTFFAAVTQGKPFNSLEVEMELPADPAPVVPVRFSFNDAYFSGVSWSSEGVAGAESFSCAFSSASIQVLRRNADGTYTEGTGYLAFYDLQVASGYGGTIDAYAPVIASVPAQTVVRSTLNNSFPVSFSDADTPADSVSFSVVSLNPELVLEGSLSVTGSGSSRTVEFDAAGLTGPATLKISATDGKFTSYRYVTVYVVETNVAPTLNGPANLYASTTGSHPFRNLTIADPNTGTGLQLVLSVGHGQLILATDVPGGLVPGQITGNGTVSVTVLADLAQLNATLADPFGLVYSTNTNADTQLTLDLADNDPADPKTDQLVIPVSVFSELFPVWQRLYFTEAELLAGTGTGELEDFDWDGVLNLIEMATGLDPTNPGDLQPMTVSVVEDGGEHYLSVSYRRLKSPGSLVYSLQFYDPISESWLDGSGSVSMDGSPSSINPQVESVSYRMTDPLAGPGTMVRLQVLQVP